MARRPRSDGPDTWHHVMNRGIARRPVFEHASDVRYFLSRLAYAVRAGGLEVHAYCLLTTHFHLLVRSPAGELSRSVGEAFNDFVRWFNRGRHRDGALFRGRFGSRPVESLDYRRQLVRYIDQNPVLAGLTPAPSLYPHGSARWYARDCGPPWLARDWIEAQVTESSRMRRYDPRAYAGVFGKPLGAGFASVIERRLRSCVRGCDPLDDLLGAAPEAVLDWMRRKAALADGTCLEWPVCDVEDVSSALKPERASLPEWTIRLSHAPNDAWQLIEIALLRELAGASWATIAARLGTSDSGASRSYARHARALDEDARYAQAAARIASAAIESCHALHGPVSAAPPGAEPAAWSAVV